MNYRLPLARIYQFHIHTITAGLVLAFLLAGCSGRSSPTQAPDLTAQPGEISTVPAASLLTATPTTMPTTLPPTPTPTLFTTPTETPVLSPTDPPATTEQTATAQPSLEPTPESLTCIDEAAYVDDITIPDFTLVDAEVQLVKTWRIRNTGNCAWKDYALVFAGGELMAAPASNPLPVVEPDQNLDVSIDIVSPKIGGQYTSNWKLGRPDGTTFGFGSSQKDLIWVTINVGWEAPAPAGNDPAPVSGGDCSTVRNQGFENEVLQLMNEARAANGLQPLGMQSQLTSAALKHSIDMACRDFVGHNGADGSNWYSRVAAQGYANSSTARENIYVGDPNFGGNASGAFNWWMNSQVHRDNILFADVSEVGIAYVFASGSSYGGYYTVVFARP